MGYLDPLRDLFEISNPKHWEYLDPGISHSGVSSSISCAVSGGALKGMLFKSLPGWAVRPRQVPELFLLGAQTTT